MGSANFQKGTTAVNFGIGLLNFGSYTGLGSSSGLTRTPLIILSGEHGISDDIGPGVLAIGGLVGYRSASYTWQYGGDSWKWRWTDVYVGVRGIYHYQLLADNPKLDTYGGLSLGVRISSFKDGGFYSDNSGQGNYKSSYTNAFSGLFVGARYYFTDNIAAYGEFGYDIALLKIGLSAKF